ncbi:MAG: hypothetical protein COS09_01695, partial [Candidatus Nealsonbacteria bacterium CG01_land_8_20_14_3_00_12]
EDFKGKNIFKEEGKIIRKQLDFQELNVNTLTNLNPRYTFDN